MLDTIAAIATPPGTGGVGIIRVSGEAAPRLAQTLFRTHAMQELDPPLSERPGRGCWVGYVVDPATRRVLDEVVLLQFRAPRSFTTEDVVEFQGHAGPAVLGAVLAAVLAQGARLAAPGEFTKRAFLGGRLDLTQAEAIADLASAHSERALSLALNQMEGHLARATRELREPVKHLLAEVEAALDFPDEIDPPAPERLTRTLLALCESARTLMATAEGGRLLREGLTLAILGRPNVGKSSLLNALLQAERAIVTAAPGTTRDVLEAGRAIRGVPFRLLDTAGIRDEGADAIERLGIERSRKALAEADLRLFVFEAPCGLDPAERELLAEALAAGPTLVVGNKIDLLGPDRPPYDMAIDPPPVGISAVTGAGLAELEQAIYDVASGEALAPVQTVALNARHHAALVRAHDSLEQVLASIRNGLPPDFLSIDLKAAFEALGEITGEDLKEEIIDHIFARFCVGK